MPDEIFANPTLASIYDDLDGERNDLDHYVEIVGELGARSVLDIGCGTGVLACRLAARGIEVTGVDPADASLRVARRKPGADRVQWVHGDATSVPATSVDLATMTGNVAQVFLDDESWLAVLQGIRASLAPGGHLVFEVRNPAARAWERWTHDESISTLSTALGPVESWVETTRIDPPLVGFRWTYRFLDDGRVLTSDSTLRFRELDEIQASLESSGFTTVDVRDAPDRPGLEFVVIAQEVIGPRSADA